MEGTANVRKVRESEYSIKLTCVVAQPKNTSTSSELLNSTIRWIQQLGDSEPRHLEAKGSFHKLLESPPTEEEFFILFQSKLQMTGSDPHNGSDSYWCELSRGDDQDSPCNSSSICVNKLTIHESEFYNMLPLCPNDVYFHLAETVCGECSDESEREDSQAPIPTVVIVVSSVGGLILLIVVVVVVVCVLRKVKRQQQKKNTGKPVQVDTCILVQFYPLFTVVYSYMYFRIK